MRKLARAFVRVLAVIGLLLISGITVQARSEQAERAQFPPQGQLVDIGGGEIVHVRTWGTRGTSTDPAIVLDVSAGMPIGAWAWIADDLAASGHFVVAYDRPGMGWSSGPWQPRDSAHAADALSRALRIAGVAPPYVVVAHSFGGFSARVFAGQHQNDVTGLVLLDTTHPDGGGEVAFATWYRMLAWLGHTGLSQLFPEADGFPSLPAGEQPAASAVSRWTSHLDATAEGLEAWHDSAEQVRAASVNLREMPLLVVATGSGNHLDQQRDLLGLSRNSQFAHINADHVGMLVVEWQASQVTTEIEKFLVENGLT